MILLASARWRENTRIQWVSSRAKEVWSPRLAAVADRWAELERWSVAEGLRGAAIQPLVLADHAVGSVASLGEVALWATAHGLMVLPLKQIDSRSITSIIARPEVAREIYALRADDERNADAIGRILGFPQSCRNAFVAAWAAGVTDPTLLMEEPDGPWASNILLRWLGVRAVPHIPCSGTCQETLDLADRFRELEQVRYHDDVAAWREEMLSWPIVYSALHGIAEVTAPVLRFVTTTDVTGDEVRRTREGTRYPEEGASGTTAPFRRREIVAITSGRSFRAGLAHASGALNGFRDEAAQNGAHETVLAAAADITVDGVILDLGCGDGLLAQRLSARIGGTPVGVEKDPVRAAAAVRRLGVQWAFAGDIAGAWPVEDPKLIVLFPGRLLEMSTEDAEAVRKRLLGATWLLVYTYSDTPEGVRALTERAELFREGWAEITFLKGDSAEAMLLQRSPAPADT